jgi:hypothetical protein
MKKTKMSINNALTFHMWFDDSLVSNLRVNTLFFSLSILRFFNHVLTTIYFLQTADVVSSLYRRLHSQYGQIKNILLHVFGLGQPPSFSQRAGLVRDDFGLHKMMVIMTKSGKLFGIDNVNGKQYWTRVLKQFQEFANDQEYKIFIQRTSKYYPLSAQCAIIARDKSTGNGILYQFNPISGQPLNEGITKLNFKIQQASLLHRSGENFLKGILFIDDKNEAHVLPESSLSIADKFFFYIVDQNKGVLNGYQININNDVNNIQLQFVFQQKNIKFHFFFILTEGYNFAYLDIETWRK